MLVILGLLTGGILAGRSLIRASELRSVTADAARFSAMVHNFNTKFNGLPGDLKDATSYWGAAHATATTCRTTASTTALTCDGNGDNQVATLDGGTTYSEIHRFWQHLANAGMLEGRYTGVGGPAGVLAIVPGTNSPESKIASAGWGLYYYGTRAGNTTYYAGEYGHTFIFGSAGGTGVNDVAILRPREAENIDKKIDDGKPAYGNVRTWANTYRTGCSGSDTPSVAAYEVTRTDIQCSVLFLNAF